MRNLIKKSDLINLREKFAKLNFGPGIFGIEELIEDLEDYYENGFENIIEFADLLENYLADFNSYNALFSEENSANLNKLLEEIK